MSDSLYSRGRVGQDILMEDDGISLQDIGSAFIRVRTVYVFGWIQRWQAENLGTYCVAIGHIF